MTDTGDLSLDVQRLGEPTYTSPLALGTSAGDGRADFVPDDSRVVLDLDASSLAAVCREGDVPRSLEAAGPRQKIFFRPSDVRAAIVTAGGLCPGINDVVRSLVMTLSYHYRVASIKGIRYGLRGFVAEDAPPLDLEPDGVKSIHLQGGSLLGSSRGAPEMREIVRYLERNAIDMLFLIGGDGTQKAVQAITAAVTEKGLDTAVIGIPKTIDNDILFVDETFGFSTAVSLAREALHAAHAEATGAYNGIGLVRLMGRESGYIAAESALASGDANFVLVPEVAFDLEWDPLESTCRHASLSIL